MKKEEIMKKLVIYLCVGVMALGLTACGSGEEDNTTPSTETTQSTATEEAQGTEDTTATEEGIAGSEMDVANGWSEEMNTIKTAVVDALGEGYWPNTPIVPEMLKVLLEFLLICIPITWAKYL